MSWQPLGDSAFLWTGDRGRMPWDKIQHLHIPEVTDIVMSFDSVAVHFQPTDAERVSAWLAGFSPTTATTTSDLAQIHQVPVVYQGKDLASVADQTGLEVDEVIHLHSTATYTVAAVGFSPGFPYLMGLPERLHLPRIPTPESVAEGSVAIAGSQAGIYPNPSLGGWHVLGTTNIPLFDPEATPPSLLQPGDTVRFIPTGNVPTGKSSARGSSPPAPPPVPPSGPVEIIAPGPATTVQDLGRPGFQTSGVTPGGAADPLTARVANLLVGNPESAALLECPIQGPVLRFHQPATVAFIGWLHPNAGKPVRLNPGDTLDLRVRMTQPVGYLAIAGGIDLPPALGSRATDLRAGFGGHLGNPLQPADQLPIGSPGPTPRPGHWHVAWPHPHPRSGTLEIRYIPGAQTTWFRPRSIAAFQHSTYRISNHSNRMGLRLDGIAPERADSREMLSQPVVAGSIQVPPDGRPTVLLAERQTIGGYPQIGHVISADIRKLVQAWPGTPVRFRMTTLDEARAAWKQQAIELARLKSRLKLL
nr:5-oxoprolinase/urea amidolyase family protein [Verrucomicrobiota bacterium JB025]